MDLFKTCTFISLWLLFENKQVHNWTIHWQAGKYYKWKDWKTTWLLARLSSLFFYRCNLNSEHSSLMIALTTISPHVGPFTREGQDLLINKLLYPGFEQTAILNQVPYIASMECTRHIGVILNSIWVNNKWHSLRHNESLLDKVRYQLSICHRDLITLRMLITIMFGLPVPLVVTWHNLLTLQNLSLRRLLILGRNTMWEWVSWHGHQRCLQLTMNLRSNHW